MINGFEKEKVKDVVMALGEAMKSGDNEAVQKAWMQFHTSVAESVRADFETANGDREILAQRGFRQLTSKETEYYNALIKAGKSDNPKQAMIDLITVRAMPETVIEEVYKDLVEEHPLLSHIRFVNVKYLTRWIMNDHTAQTAVWGPINSEITKEITSSFKTVEMAQCKLSAFAIIEMDMLDLGPSFIDNYIRTFLKEAIACALEKAIVSGTGHNEPIGLDRDIHDGVTVSTTTGYPKKTAVSLKSFMPEDYGQVLAKLAKTEKERMRKFDSVTLVCNMEDYLCKIMPATTMLTSSGVFAKDLFPFPTTVIRSNEVKTGEAILFLPEEYFMGIGTSKDGTIEYSDEFKFLEDKRTFKIKMHGMGRAYDDTVAVLLDISKLEPTYIFTKDKSGATA